MVSIELPDTLKNIGECAFQNSGLQEIILPEKLDTIYAQAFRNNDSLEKIDMGDKVTRIGQYAFRDCDSLLAVEIPDSVTYMEKYVFEHCDLLEEVQLGNGLTTIPAYTFNQCSALTSVALSYRTQAISNNAFTNCTSLTEVTIPRATTSIGSNAFSYPTKMNVYGVAGTYAETWAQNVGATFVNKEVKATGVTLEQESLTVYKGKSVALKAIIEPEGVTDVISWRSSDTGVVTVSDLGVVKAVGVGSATVRVTVGDYSASCKVTVVQPITSISLNKTSLSM